MATAEPRFLESDRYRLTEGQFRLLLVIEVAGTTLARDRRGKLPVYARAGVREVWIVNLPGRALEVYRDPHQGDYQRTETLTSGTVTPGEPTLSGVALDLSTLF